MSPVMQMIALFVVGLGFIGIGVGWLFAGLHDYNLLHDKLPDFWMGAFSPLWAWSIALGWIAAGVGMLAAVIIET